MKSDHRHELKTNALADWMSHIPEWSKKNTKPLIGGTALVVLVVVAALWSQYGGWGGEPSVRRSPHDRADRRRRVQGVQSGAYQVVVLNDTGSVDSEVAALQVAAPATINQHPLSVLLNPGENVTFTVDADGATGSKMLLTLTVGRRDFTGTALADLTWVISGAAAKVAWTSTTASGTASAATLKDVIDLINEIDGFKAWALHAPHSASVNSGFFIDLVATGIKSGVGLDGVSEVLNRDISEYVDANSDKVAWMRIGLPEVRDRDSFELMDVFGQCTGVTNGRLRISITWNLECAGELL